MRIKCHTDERNKVLGICSVFRLYLEMQGVQLEISQDLVKHFSTVFDECKKIVHLYNIALEDLSTWNPFYLIDIDFYKI